MTNLTAHSVANWSALGDYKGGANIWLWFCVATARETISFKALWIKLGNYVKSLSLWVCNGRGHLW